MLPRRIFMRALTYVVAPILCASVFGAAPAQSLTVSPPRVNVTELHPDSNAVSNTRGNLVSTDVIAPRATSRFALVGVTWTEGLDPSTIFRIRTRSQSVWSTWRTLHYSQDHGVDARSAEAHGARIGTDPLITGESDGVALRLESKSGQIPTGLELSLIDSPMTTQDRLLARRVRSGVAPVASSVSSPQGAVVQRPVIVTRAQWGADESWRDPIPRMGTTIIAGFIHHTATTSNYTPEQAPAQMRNLYAYFTKSLKYADMGYNFLVDKYGTIYEGRAGCTASTTDSCDGPSLPVQGAHTAGMNEDTFAISVIGNFDTVKPTDDAAAVIVNSLARLAAWKLAPYGLNPKDMTSVTSTDTSGKSRYGNGEVARTYVLSAHRDVGLTVCPGRYLYTYMDLIRTQATLLLKPVLQKLSVSPALVNSDMVNTVAVTAIVPAKASWTVSILSNADGSLVSTASGTQETTSSIAFQWDLRNFDGELVAPGSYSIVVGASVQDVQLASATTGVLVAHKPIQVGDVSVTKVDNLRSRIDWPQSDTSPLPLIGYRIRFSGDHKKTWGEWKKLGLKNSYVFKSLQRKHRYVIEIVATNQFGQSDSRYFGFVA
jgi:N-acetylmuramoyl-L-alanine amidase